MTAFAAARLSIALAALAVLPACASRTRGAKVIEARWRVFDGPIFSVDLPGEPLLRSKVRKGQKGTLHLVAHHADVKTSEHGVLGVVYIHLPDAYPEVDAKEQLHAWGPESVRLLGGKVHIDSSFSLKSADATEEIPCGHLVHELNGKLLRMTTCVAGRWTIQVVHAAPPSEDHPEIFQRVVDSLRIRTASGEHEPDEEREHDDPE